MEWFMINFTLELKEPWLTYHSKAAKLRLHQISLMLFSHRPTACGSCGELFISWFVCPAHCNSFLGGERTVHLRMAQHGIR
uniref:Uncharacterized protein n=2 Tax=Anguilla anguilla TaxID=7936 RepID=A0A0E9TA83_ANGAN